MYNINITTDGNPNNNASINIVIQLSPFNCNIIFDVVDENKYQQIILLPIHILLPNV